MPARSTRAAPRTLAVLRPEPGNAATCTRARAAGFDTLALPLFAVVPLGWSVADPAGYDALILTSANALRLGGPQLGGLRALPVLAVGAKTADAARAAGFAVTLTGTGDAAALVALAEAHGITRALHLTGRERTIAAGGPIAATVAVYENRVREIAPGDLARLAGTTALLHSPRAAVRLAALVDASRIGRGELAVAAFSAAIAVAAGEGWAALAVAATPDDAALFAAIDRGAAAAKR